MSTGEESAEPLPEDFMMPGQVGEVLVRRPLSRGRLPGEKPRPRIPEDGGYYLELDSEADESGLAEHPASGAGPLRRRRPARPPELRLSSPRLLPRPDLPLA